MSWTDDRIERLKTMWAEGMSASQIARALGEVTRNAVIGKVHRLGLAGRATPVARVERPRPAPQPRVAAPPRPSPMRAVQVVEEPLEPMPETAVTVVDLNASTCKWPLGDPTDANFRFCGRRAGGSSPYCEAHTRMAYQPAQSRRDRERERAEGFNRPKINFG
jgi:GcrA cell cycle regulator